MELLSQRQLSLLKDSWFIFSSCCLDKMDTNSPLPAMYVHMFQCPSPATPFYSQYFYIKKIIPWFVSPAFSHCLNDVSLWFIMMNRKDFEETTLLILSHSWNKTKETLLVPHWLSCLFSMECVFICLCSSQEVRGTSYLWGRHKQWECVASN